MAKKKAKSTTHPPVVASPQNQPIVGTPQAYVTPIGPSTTGVLSMFDLSQYTANYIMSPSEAEKYVDEHYLAGLAFGDVMTLTNSKIWTRTRAAEWVKKELKRDPNFICAFEVPQLLYNNIWTVEQVRKYINRPSIKQQINTNCALSFYNAGIWNRDETRAFLKIGPVPYEGPADFTTP